MGESGSLDSLERGTVEWNSGMVGGAARLMTRCIVLELQELLEC